MKFKQEFHRKKNQSKAVSTVRAGSLKFTHFSEERRELKFTYFSEGFLSQRELLH